MKNRVIYSQWKNPPHIKPHTPKGERLVDLTGYLPTEKRIMQMMAAGIVLQASRHGYDVPPGKKVKDDDLEIDPTRAKDFDFADASMHLNRIAARNKARAAAKKESVPVEKKEVKPSEKEVSDGEKKPAVKPAPAI